MKRNIFKLDERDLNIFRKVCTTLYLVTIFALISIQAYRQFIRHQPMEEWNDIAMLLTANILATLGAFLYATGVVGIQKFKLHHALIGFGAFVTFGFTFTIIKDTIFLGQAFIWAEVLNSLWIVVKVSALLALGLGLAAYLGSRRIEKLIE